jgi:hypothetical protein
MRSPNIVALATWLLIDGCGGVIRQDMPAATIGADGLPPDQPLTGRVDRFAPAA